MKKKKIIVSAFSVVVVSMFLSCTSQPCSLAEQQNTEPAAQLAQPAADNIVWGDDIINPGYADMLMPFTTSIFQRLYYSDENFIENIGRYQFLLSGRIFLEREFTESETALTDGQVRFQDIFVRENITINDHTDGQALDIQGGYEAILFVCFEHDDEYQLVFTNNLADPDSFFHLTYDPMDVRYTAASDERGFIQYGSTTYRLRYSGESAPYLMIRLSHTDIDRINSRIAPGRTIH